MQGVLNRFLPTLFFVITIAAGHKTQSRVHDGLSVIFISSRVTFECLDYSFIIRFHEILR